MFLAHSDSQFLSNSHFSDLQKRYDRALKKELLHSHKCPCCGTVSRMKVHSSYQRRLYNDASSQIVTIWIAVLFCPCKTCPHPYHAFLPSWICPFCMFTYSFLMSVLGFFYGQGNRKINTTAKNFHLSRTTVRKITKRFSREDWLIQQTTLAKSQAHSSTKVLAELASSTVVLCQFLIDFLFVNQIAFFTRHFPQQSRWAFIAYRIWDL